MVSQKHNDHIDTAQPADSFLANSQLTFRYTKCYFSSMCYCSSMPKSRQPCGLIEAKSRGNDWNIAQRGQDKRNADNPNGRDELVVKRALQKPMATSSSVCPFEAAIDEATLAQPSTRRPDSFVRTLTQKSPYFSPLIASAILLM